MSSGAHRSDVYAVLRVRDVHGEVEVQVGDHRYVGWFLYRPKAFSLRDRLYIRLLASDAVVSTGLTQTGIDLAGVVVALDARGISPLPNAPGTRVTLRIVTVQRGGAELSTEVLATGRLDEAPLPSPRRVSQDATVRMALPSVDDAAPVPSRPKAPSHGKLGARTMSDLVHALLEERAVASIEVHADAGLGGSVFLEGGSVVAAWAGAVRGLEAVLQLSTYVGASFRVRPGCTTVMRNVDEPAALVERALQSIVEANARGAKFTDEPTMSDTDRTMPSQP